MGRLLSGRSAGECASLECLETEPREDLVRSAAEVIQHSGGCFDPEEMTSHTRIVCAETELEVVRCSSQRVQL